LFVPFALLRSGAFREQCENRRAVLIRKSACSSKKLDRPSNAAETIARRKLHASVSLASQAGENKAPAELALARFVFFAPPVDGASGKKGE
jgi:hypothetical protein